MTYKVYRYQQHLTKEVHEASIQVYQMNTFHLLVPLPSNISGAELLYLPLKLLLDSRTSDKLPEEREARLRLASRRRLLGAKGRSFRVLPSSSGLSDSA